MVSMDIADAWHCYGMELMASVSNGLTNLLLKASGGDPSVNSGQDIGKTGLLRVNEETQGVWGCSGYFLTSTLGHPKNFSRSFHRTTGQ